MINLGEIIYYLCKDAVGNSGYIAQNDMMSK